MAPQMPKIELQEYVYHLLYWPFHHRTVVEVDIIDLPEAFKIQGFSLTHKPIKKRKLKYSIICVKEINHIN